MGDTADPALPLKHTSWRKRERGRKHFFLGQRGGKTAGVELQPVDGICYTGAGLGSGRVVGCKQARY